MLGQHCMIFLCINLFAISVVSAADPKKIQQYGHHVSVRKDGEHLCSGSIIGSRFILTSQWCISLYTSKDNITVVAGTKSLEIFGDTYQIEKVIVPDSSLNDIAILRTKKDIIFHDDIRYIAIGSHYNYNDDYELSYTGWERSNTGERSEILQQYTAKLYDKTTCRDENDLPNISYMCIYDPSGTQVCNRESGGAIVANGTQIGINIDKGWCHNIAKPAKHTPLGPYIDWIQENMKLEDDIPTPQPVEESKRDASLGEYPYHVSIRHNDEHVCSGSIISQRHILTSINCIMRYKPKTLTVMVGISSLNETGDTYPVEEVERYPDYKYDIAIMKLVSGITFKKNVKSIPIVKSGKKYRDSEKIMLTGWQRKDSCGPISDKLQHISFHTVETEKCKQLIPFVNTLYMCSMEESSHSCNIDHGSPIVSNGVQIALNPANVGCGERFDPQLHLPLYKVATWIKRHSRVKN